MGEPPMFRRFARKTLRYFADWSRLGAGYRRQDCQNGLRCAGTHKGAKIRKGHKGSWLIS